MEPEYLNCSVSFFFYILKHCDKEENKMLKVLRVVVGVLVSVAGIVEGADIASGGWLYDKLTHMADKAEEEEDDDECDE